MTRYVCHFTQHDQTVYNNGTDGYGGNCFHKVNTARGGQNSSWEWRHPACLLQQGTYLGETGHMLGIGNVGFAKQRRNKQADIYKRNTSHNLTSSNISQ